MTKNSLIVVVVGANLFLLACLLLAAYRPPQALAAEVGEEAAATEKEYILIAARASVSNDAIYLLDVNRKLLHAFRTNNPRSAIAQPVVVTYIDTRDLARDFPKPRRDRKEASP